MNARDWFNLIRDRVEKLEHLEADMETKRAAVLPKGQQFEPSTHCSTGDGSTAMLLYVQADTELDVKRREVEALLERGTDVLYGRSGRGGLAKARSSADADCIFGYYLLGMSWREVADEMVRPESKDARHWCMMKAHRAFEYMDRVGMDWLTDS